MHGLLLKLILRRHVCLGIDVTRHAAATISLTRLHQLHAMPLNRTKQVGAWTRKIHCHLLDTLLDTLSCTDLPPRRLLVASLVSVSRVAQLNHVSFLVVLSAAVLHTMHLVIFADDSILVVGLVQRRALALTTLAVSFVEGLAELKSQVRDVLSCYYVFALILLSLERQDLLILLFRPFGTRLARRVKTHVVAWLLTHEAF